jgi:hypothetical protein
MVNADECVWGDDFFSTYMKHARKMSYNNDILHMSGALSLVGQSLRDVYLQIDQQHIDCRIHPFIVQSSGTGKGSTFNLIRKVARAADIPFEKEGKATTAGLAGTVDQSGEQQPGDLKGSGFLGWTEAQTLLKSADQQHSSDIMEFLNMAMDPSGEIAKTLSKGKLEYESNTSIFCTTYDPEPNGQLELIRQGFLPRTLFFYRIMGEEFYDKVNEKRNKNIPRSFDSEKPQVREMDEDIQKMANTLKFVENTVWNHGETYRRDETHFAVAREHIDYFYVQEGVSLNPSPMMDDVLEGRPIAVRRKAKAFKTRMMDSVYRLAACFAAVDYDEEYDVYVSRRIRQQHVDKAMRMCRQSFNNILDFIDDYSTFTSNSQLKDVERKINVIAEENGGHATIKEVMSETYRSKKQIKNDVTTLEYMGKVEAVEKPVQGLNVNDEIKPVT